MIHLGYGRAISLPEWKAGDISVSLASLLRHQYVIGSTGSGKTAYLLNLVHQLIRGRHGFTIVDLEEALAQPVLSYLAEAGWPPEKLIYINPTLDQVIPLNVLLGGYSAVEDVLASMRRAWLDSWGDRMHDLLKHSLKVLQLANLTLGELTAFLSNQGFRNRVLREVNDEAISNYFLYHLGNLSASQFRLIVESSRNKASQFTENPYIRPLVSAETCFDFKVAMDEGYAVVVDIPERLLKDSARLLAMLILGRIQSAALRRVEGTFAPHFVILDEFQSYVSRHVIEMLTRARKRGLGLTVAHQNLQQPPFDKDPAFLSTVLANTNVQAYFELGRDDAEKLVRHAFTASGTEVKRQKDHWLWGSQGEPRWFSVQEELEFYATELADQEVRECIIRIRERHQTCFATTYDLPIAPAAAGATLAEASVRIHGIAVEAIREAQEARVGRFFPRKPKRPAPGADEAV